ncbi:MAG: VanW family protein [Candidatus Pacebacteria bacterium]|nr:VanW family protein [Candidatus Paceibacterota bacterium]
MLSKLRKKLILVFLFSVITLMLFSVLFYFYTENFYRDKAYPNIYVGNVNVGGKTAVEINEIISNNLALVGQDGIRVYLDTDSTVIYPINSFLDGELNEFLIDFKVDKTVENVFKIGRSNTFFNDFKDRIDLFLFEKHKDNSLIFEINERKIIDKLKSKFYIYESSDAFYFFDEDDNLSVESEYFGKKIDYEQTILVLKNNLSQFNFSSIPLAAIKSAPNISKDDCLEMKDAVVYVIGLAPIVLAYEGKEWSIEKQDLLSWIKFEKDINSENRKINLYLDKGKISVFLKNEIASKIDIEPTMPKFIIENGKVKNFEPGINGISLDIDSVSNILAMIPIENINNLDLLFKKTSIASDVKNEDGDNLGIKDILGQSSLSFAGSTVNRIKNITNASNSINGLLIAPNEEFSTIKNLLPIDGTNGYLKEIVINGKNISYEYGGGVCHLSTTFFRSVLDSGLPITMRQNHSYNMPYYFPAGTDASVYDPTPDFRFINDTGNYVLIQSKIVNSALVIELWGTYDGRKITKGESVVYNIIKPKSARMVATNTLPKGKVSCTYSAYSGADAYFDYKVEYNDGTIKETRFKSHYVPRQGVCMIGR